MKEKSGELRRGGSSEQAKISLGKTKAYTHPRRLSGRVTTNFKKI
jgi:hypothetical protein